ncbi:MAG TPA: MarR family transcriptional regulator [Acidimicrobiales bacterium]|jgi:DNA-binding MarR family transcriptional regulator|nr:MarR family transcriptional regulator [Acidimicrobiales bacterium]
MQTSGRDDAAVDAFLVASRALVGVAAQSLADVDITLPQYRALIVLWTRPGVTVTDLAEALDIHASTATRMCDRLARKQLVRRTQGTADRRATELRLAAAGRRLVERVTDRRRRAIAAITATLSPDVTAAAVAALDAFARAAGEPTGVDLFGWDDGAVGQPVTAAPPV